MKNAQMMRNANNGIQIRSGGSRDMLEFGLLIAVISIVAIVAITAVGEGLSTFILSIAK